MSNSHLVSIILPVFNGDKYLAFAIQSCLDQTYKNLELVIVDDGSTDDSLEIARTFSRKDSRIRVIENLYNQKLPESLNIGHREARGEYITWTSHDNLLKPNFIQNLVNSILNKKADIVFSNYDIILENGKLKRIHVPGPVEKLILGNYIGASFLYKKEVFEELEGFNTNLFLVEDYDFWLRALFKFKFYHVDQNLYSYRIHNESLTSKIDTLDLHQKQFKSGLNEMFYNLAEDLKWHPETISLIFDIRENKPASIENYLKNKDILKADLNKLVMINSEKIWLILLSQLRLIWIDKKEIKNRRTLFKVISQEKEILFHPIFSLKETGKLIFNSLIQGCTWADNYC